MLVAMRTSAMERVSPLVQMHQPHRIVYRTLLLESQTMSLLHVSYAICFVEAGGVIIREYPLSAAGAVQRLESSASYLPYTRDSGDIFRRITARRGNLS